MNILTFTGHYLPGYKGGGPIKTIKNLFDQTGNSMFYKLITSDRDLGDTLPYNSIDHNTWNKVGNAEVFYIQSGNIGYKQIIKILFERDYELIYLNSFFSPTFSVLPLIIAKTLRQKVIVGPRGEFSEGALSLKSRKKNTFIKLYKLLNLHRGTIYQASSIYEAEDIKRVLGPKVDIVIAEDIGAQEFAKNIAIREQIIKAVFISRISPMKNLGFALETFKSVQNPLVYDIYGPIEDQSYWQHCQSIISDLPSHIDVHYKGELTPEQVVPILSSYDFFFMPTKGENYGHVIAEALCAGLPLLISDATPWRNLSEQGLGWDLPLDNPSAFSSAINKLALMSKDDHHEIRKNVLKWARNKFSQRDAIDANIAMFEYAANK
ncbi:glycosyltransferase [Psychrobacter sp. ANT_H59]|uniref:glycosyltransferase n=1 Tax=Psychrobacter sp. ANT_H59 TaxID=2597354 RepID=UPI0011ED5C80|nr:glycosyltransferase [Psychrobacter sp. ANT_H59]KAA0933456.1 glycosyltransferase [Psychrobacter sp. ANT_H59]